MTTPTNNPDLLRAAYETSDAYAGAREDLAIWKKRALEAEALNHRFIADINGPTFVGEPAYSDSALLAREMYKSQDDSLPLCASDLQQSAIYDNHVEMQSCMWAVAERITDLAAGPQPAPTADSVTAPAGGVVAYLDIGAGGYLDLGSDLSNEAISRLPKGRHALIVAGTYGIDGYTPIPPAQAADSVLEDAARYRWLADYLVGDLTDLDDEIVACKSVYDLSKVVDAARKQGANHD